MKPHCKTHPDTELVCPKCVGKSGGAKAAKRMTGAARSQRAKKASSTRWNLFHADAKKGQ